MNACSTSNLAWQVNIPAILSNIKNELQAVRNRNVACQQPVPKELTTEALIMLFIIFIFIVLTVIASTGSTVNCLYKYFRNTISSKIVREKVKAGKGTEHAEAHEFLLRTDSSKICKSFLDCFPVQYNSRKLLSTRTIVGEEHLRFLHGIRALAVIWISAAHISMLYGYALRTLTEEVVSVVKSPYSQFLSNGAFANDIFFALSGFLNGYKFFDYYKKRKGNIPWTLFYLSTFLRFTPLYFIVLGFYATLFSYIGSGPIWPTYHTNPVCRENWLWNVFYLNNFLPHTKQCMIVSWFIACYLQLYVVSPLFLLPLVKRPKFGYVLVAICISASCLLSFMLTLKFNLTDGSSKLTSWYDDMKEFNLRYWIYFDVIHIKPYTRMNSYLVGTLLGYFVYKRRFNQAKRQTMTTLCIGWTTCFLCLWFSFFALYNKEESLFERAVYNGAKVLFSCSTGWVLFVCVTGQGGILSKFLSLKIFVPVSRLSCCIYFIHLIVIEWYFLSLNQPVDYSLISQTLLIVELTLWILFASFVVSLIFERPLLNLLGLLIRDNKQRMKAQ